MAWSALKSFTLYSEIQRSRLVLAVEEKKRQHMAVEILRLAEEDAYTSERLVQAVENARKRCCVVASGALSTAIRICILRRLRSIMFRLRNVKRQRRPPSHKASCVALAYFLVLLFHRSIRPAWRSLRGMPESKSSEILGQRVTVHELSNNGRIGDKIRASLAQRAGQIARLEEKLVLRNDVRLHFRPTNVSVATFSSSLDLCRHGQFGMDDGPAFLGQGPSDQGGLEAVNFRSVRLLAYLVGSSVRNQLRSGLQAMIAAPKMCKSHRRGRSVGPLSPAPLPGRYRQRRRAESAFAHPPMAPRARRSDVNPLEWSLMGQ